MRAHDVMVIVFVRRPRAGQVKRRLAHALGARRAARLYHRLLARTLAVVRACGPARCVLMPAARADSGYFRKRRPAAGWQVRAQCHGDLGQRMAHAMAWATSSGTPALLIGSDLIDIEVADLRAAAAALAAGVELVLGPAADGGYWLIGLRQACAQLFMQMTWSGAGVLAATLARSHDVGLSVQLVSRRHDLDRAADLLRGRARRLLQA